MYETQRVGIFIDTQNIYHSAKVLFQARVDYKEVLETAIRGRRLIRAFAYVIKSDVEEESKFFDALNELGIETRMKDLQVFFGGAKKGDWDVGIAIDIVRMLDKLDVVVLISGDGDFTELLKYVKSRGVKAEVIAFSNSTSSMLLEEVDQFYDLGEEGGRYLLKRNVRRSSRPPKSSASAGSTSRSSSSTPKTTSTKKSPTTSSQKQAAPGRSAGRQSVPAKK